MVVENELTIINDSIECLNETVINYLEKLTHNTETFNDIKKSLDSIAISLEGILALFPISKKEE